MIKFSFIDPIFDSKINVTHGMAWQAFLDTVFRRYTKTARGEMEWKMRSLRERPVPPLGFVYGYGDAEVALYLDKDVDVTTVKGQSVVMHECHHVACRIAEALASDDGDLGEEWCAHYQSWVYEKVTSRILKG